ITVSIAIAVSIALVPHGDAIDNDADPRRAYAPQSVEGRQAKPPRRPVSFQDQQRSIGQRRDNSSVGKWHYGWGVDNDTVVVIAKLLEHIGEGAIVDKLHRIMR